MSEIRKEKMIMIIIRIFSLVFLFFAVKDLHAIKKLFETVILAMDKLQ
jgi:hypothetical protein